MFKKVLLVLTIFIVLGAIAFLVIAPAKVDSRLNGVRAHEPYTTSQYAKDLHATLLIGDWHADSLLWNRDLNKAHDYGHVDIPRLQAGNVGLQMFTTVTKSPSGLNYDENSADAPDDITKLAIAQLWPLGTWSSLTERARHQAQKLHDFAARNSDLRIIKNKRDLAAFVLARDKQANLVGGLLGTEGSHALDGNLQNIQTLFDAGFRMMSLHHFFDNKLGGSLHGLSQAGLSDFGRSVVAKINQLNIVLDLSHSSEAVVADVLDMYEPPIVLSHTGFKGHCNSARNISDALMQKIAQKGGLIAIGYWEAAVCGDAPKDVVAAMKYGLSLVGEDHISLGSDFDGSISTAFDTSELVVLTHEMLEQGFSETQIRKIMGGNMYKFLKQGLPN